MVASPFQSQTGYTLFRPGVLPSESFMTGRAGLGPETVFSLQITEKQCNGELSSFRHFASSPGLIKLTGSPKPREREREKKRSGGRDGAAGFRICHKNLSW